MCRRNRAPAHRECEVSSSPGRFASLAQNTFVERHNALVSGRFGAVQLSRLLRRYQQHDGGLLSMKHDPMLTNVEHDPRYKALLRKMNLPE